MDEYLANLELQKRELEAYRKGVENILSVVNPYIPDELALWLEQDLLGVVQTIKNLSGKTLEIRKLKTERMEQSYARDLLES